MNDLMIDDAAQRLYLSSMLGNPKLFSRVQHLLKPSYFDSSLQEAIVFLKSFYQEYRGIPSETVFNTKTKLNNIEPVTLPDQDIKFVAEQIADFCQIRAVTEAVLKAPALIESGDLGKMVQQIKLATQVQLHSDLGLDYFKDPIARLEETEANSVLYPTGWDDVDELIGGIGRQELILFTANSGGGKSMVMLNLGYNLISRGMNGVYISLEMRDGVVAKRLDSMISRISGKNIYSNKLKVGHEIQIFKEKTNGQFFIKRMREGTTTADHIASYLHELEAVHGFTPDFIIVDYLDLMASVQKHDGGNMFTKDKYVTEEVRALGLDFDAIIVSASQLGRSAIVATREDKALGQDHIQGGMSKINTSDLVIALVKDEAMDAAGIYRFEFLKSRNSNAVNKKIEMVWDAESLRITDMSKRNMSKILKPATKASPFSMPDVRPGAKTPESPFFN
jgi:replicative DNA helicase